jgi:hypothetical protein
MTLCTRTSHRVFAVFCIPILVCLGCGHADSTPELDDAGTLFLESQNALKSGDRARSMELLNQSINAQPYAWSLLERAKLYAEDGNDKAASADVAAGLALDPHLKDLIWLRDELKKPKEQRLKTQPPSAVK